MTTIIGGSSPSITFSDSTTQTTAFTGSASTITSGTLPFSVMPAGSVLQVVSTTTTLSFSTSSGSFVTTGLTASITPKSATNKILILISGIFSTQSSNLSTQLAVYRGGSAVLTVGGQYAAAAGYMAVFNSPQYLDSPATTSSTTYTLYSRISAGAGTTSCSDPTTITLMEIAA
jgi:hypothetical protein